MHLAQIIVIGPQNLFVLQNGMKNHQISVPIICILLDILMILVMLFGVIRVLAENYWILKFLQLSGVVFLVTYGIKSILSANKIVNIDGMLKQQKHHSGILKNAIYVSVLNPGAWLDTLTISTIALEYSGFATIFFYLGIVISSAIWFLGISTFGKLASIFLHKPKTWQIIHIFTGTTMICMAIKLLL